MILVLPPRAGKSIGDWVGPEQLGYFKGQSAPFYLKSKPVAANENFKFVLNKAIKNNDEVFIFVYNSYFFIKTNVKIIIKKLLISLKLSNNYKKLIYKLNDLIL